jgi:hypothetical protein
LTFTDSAGTATVTLNGTVVAPTLTPATVAFGGVTRGSTSATTLVTFANTSAAACGGGCALTVGATFTNTGNFGRSTTTAGTCGTTVAAGSSCTIGVVFHPPTTDTAGSAQAGTLTVDGGLTGTTGTTNATSLTGTAN